jgi:hypothetical protein
MFFDCSKPQVTPTSIHDIYFDTFYLESSQNPSHHVSPLLRHFPRQQPRSTTAASQASEISPRKRSRNPTQQPEPAGEEENEVQPPPHPLLPAHHHRRHQSPRHNGSKPHPTTLMDPDFAQAIADDVDRARVTRMLHQIPLLYWVEHGDLCSTSQIIYLGCGHPVVNPTRKTENTDSKPLNTETTEADSIQRLPSCCLCAYITTPSKSSSSCHRRRYQRSKRTRRTTPAPPQRYCQPIPDFARDHELCPSCRQAGHGDGAPSIHSDEEVEAARTLLHLNSTPYVKRGRGER